MYIHIQRTQQTANHWDYPVDDTSNSDSQSQYKNGMNHDDMFKNHGSRQSMDIV